LINESGNYTVTATSHTPSTSLEAKFKVLINEQSNNIASNTLFNGTKQTIVDFPTLLAGNKLRICFSEKNGILAYDRKYVSTTGNYPIMITVAKNS